MARLFLLLCPALLLAACGTPKDPKGATDRIRSAKVLRVGIADNPPWMRAADGDPRGIEADLVRQFADSLGARVDWTPASETVLAEKLKQGELDLVAAGLDSKTVWKKELAMSQVYLRDSDMKKHVILAEPGENQLLLRLDRFLLTAKPGLQAQAGAA